MTTTIIITIVSVSAGIFVQVWKLFETRVLFRRYLAAAVLFIPAFIHSYGNGRFIKMGLYGSDLFPSVLVGGFFSCLAVLTTYLTASRPENIQRYPEIRVHVWSPLLFAQNVASWTAYLLAYEFLFRGYLFLGLYESDPVLAFLINSIIYVLAHLHKGSREALLSFPFGILLCLVALYTQGIWSVAMIHISLAISNDYFALRANPYFKYHSFISNRNLQS